MVFILLVSLSSVLALRRKALKEGRSVLPGFRSKHWLVPLSLAMMWVGGCNSSRYGVGGTADQAMVTGEVVYRERMMLPPGSLVTVRLEERGDVERPGRLIGEGMVLTNEENLPLEWEIDFDRGELSDDARLVLQAKIESPDGKLMFVSYDYYPVDPKKPGWHELLVRQVPEETRQMSLLRKELVESTWYLTELDGMAIPQGTGVYLQLTPTGKVTGSSGCNRIMGGFKLTDDGLEISRNMASTLMTCEGKMELEAKVLHAFKTHDRIEMGAEGMTLFKGDRVIAVFSK